MDTQELIDEVCQEIEEENRVIGTPFWWDKLRKKIKEDKG